MTELEDYIEQGLGAGCAPEQMQNFVQAGVVLQPRQLAASAAARLREVAGPTGSGAEWNAVKSRRVRRPGGRPSAVCWRGGLPRPADGVKAPGERNSRLLAGRGKWLRVLGREGALSAPGAGAGFVRRKRGG